MKPTTAGGPVQPVAATLARPLQPGPFVSTNGFWATRQALVRENSLPHAWHQLEQTGRLRNFSGASLAGTQAYLGDPYADSDVYKTLEATLWENGRSPSSRLLDLARSTADLLAAGQREDGYLHSWFQRPDSPAPYSDMQMGHELYCHGHLIQAAIAEHRTGVELGLMPMARQLADHHVRRFSDPEMPMLCGHPLIEMALVELYRTTLQTGYLDLAARMLEARGRGSLGPGPYGSQYYQDDRPIREATTPVGHCVRALYLASGATDLAAETGDQELLHALSVQWDSLVANKTYLTGGVGCRRKDEAFGAPYELPPDHAFAETCAGAGMFMWGWRMLLATGEARYADMMERLLYNLLPAGLSDDGRAFSYINPLHKRPDSPEHGDKRTVRQAWFRCPCCPPNLMRLVASLGHYVATQDMLGLQLHQFLAGRLRGQVPGGEVVLDVATDYPHEGDITIRVVEGPGTEWTMSLRLPAWCFDVRLSVAGVPQATNTDKDGYLRLTQLWPVGTAVRLQLSMPFRLTYPDPRVDSVRGCVAVERGPLVYCLEQQDASSGLDALSLVPSSVLTAVPDQAGMLLAQAVASESAPPSWPYQPVAKSARAGTGVEVRLRPYHAWGNQGDAPMRVWLPVAGTAPSAT